MKKGKKSKRGIVFIAVVLLICGFIVGIVLYANANSNSYTFSEKQWINNNVNNVIDVGVTSDLPMFSMGGSGVFYKYMDALSIDTSLSFNIVSDGTNDIMLTHSSELKDTDVVFYTDEYVVISPTDKQINSFSDIAGSTIGVLADDLTYVSAYLSDKSGLTFATYNSIDSMIEALGDSIIYAIVPKSAYLNGIMYNSLNIIYNIEDLNDYYVLRFNGEVDKIDDIMAKFFVRWSKEKLNQVYNEQLLSIYYKAKDFTEIQKESITSNDFIVGYISNLPYEGMLSGKFSGINNQYLEDFAALTGATYKYVEYSNLNALKNAIDNKKVDIVFNMYDLSSSNYSNSASLGNIKYVVLAHKSNSLYLNSINGLKNKEVVMLGDNNLYNGLKTSEVFTIKPYDSFKKLCKGIDENSIILLPKAYYEYYKSSKLKDYTIRYTDVSNVSNTFLMNNEKISFNNLFNFYLTMSSANRIEQKAINVSLEKYTNNLIVAFIVKYVAYIIAVCLSLIFVLYKLSKKIKITKKIKREDKMMYLDIMTNLKNRNYLNENITYWNSNKVYPQAIVTIDLRNIKILNDRYGHEEGDKQIKAAANILIKTQRENSEIIRIDGDEFLVYLVGYDEKQVITYMHKLNKEFKNMPYQYGVSLGYSMILDDVKTLDDAINDALQMTKENKEVQSAEK